jgi:NAD(P)H dehydrogenase (quinone)
MKVSVILAHPSPASFNHAIARTVLYSLRRNGHEVVFHDLCAESFDPALPPGELGDKVTLPPYLETHCREISAAEGLVIIHPNWWGQPPAILKGWVDRVLRENVAYRFAVGDSGAGLPEGLLKIRAALIFNTSNTPAERELAEFGDPLERLWRDCIFGFLGIKNVERHLFSVIAGSTSGQREEWLGEVPATVGLLFPRDRD